MLCDCCNILGIDQARLLHLILISISFIFISFIPIFCYLNYLNCKLTLICSTFIGTINYLHFILLFVFTSWRTIVEMLVPSDVTTDVLHSLGKSTEFICGKLRSPDGAVMAFLRRSPINGGVQFSPLSMLHLICSAISRKQTTKLLLNSI